MRFPLSVAALTLILPAGLSDSAAAQHGSPAAAGGSFVQPGNAWGRSGSAGESSRWRGAASTAGRAHVPPEYASWRPSLRHHRGIHPHDYTHYDYVPPRPTAYSHGRNRGHYPYLHAPMYPSPQPDVPHQVGSTAYTNQAFAPHEMLYPHEYHAMYPPYYYKVKGHWMVTPLGVWSWDKWKLQGTEVKVKYHSHISPLAGFFPPSTR